MKGLDVKPFRPFCCETKKTRSDGAQGEQASGLFLSTKQARCLLSQTFKQEGFLLSQLSA